jgi:hypothetical protein
MEAEILDARLVRMKTLVAALEADCSISAEPREMFLKTGDGSCSTRANIRPLSRTNAT